MAKGECKKCEEEECECPEWIFTFSDLVMLLMGFFVILWVLKPAPGNPSGPADNQKLAEIQAALWAYFDFRPDPNNKQEMATYEMVKRMEQLKHMKGPGDGGKTDLHQRGLQGSDPEVENFRHGNQATEGGWLFFEAGQTVLTDESIKKLDKIIQLFKGHRNITLVKGHAARDELGDAATALQQMDLSIRRAQIVADYLVRNGMDADTIRVQGCSIFEPINERVYGANSQQLNRRAEIQATTTLVDQLQNRPTSGPVENTPAAP
jgi:chemotaxis protein MotB